MTVLAAHAWPDNGALIADVARLYFPENARVCDPTFGRGKWWTRYQPAWLFASDLALSAPVDSGYYLFQGGVDFRSLPYSDDFFDVVTFDPPYVAKGGRSTSGIGEFDSRYGLADAPRTPEQLAWYNADGIAECVRVARPGGLILVKCKDYISSGKFFDATTRVILTAHDLNLDLIDRLEHVRASAGVQPPGRRQVHARRNLSTLFVFKKRS